MGLRMRDILRQSIISMFVQQMALIIAICWCISILSSRVGELLLRLAGLMFQTREHESVAQPQKGDFTGMCSFEMIFTSTIGFLISLGLFSLVTTI